MFRKNKVVWVSVVIVAAMLCGMGMGIAMAKAPLNPIDGNGVISAAYQKVNGMLRLVNGQEDVKPSEVFIQWNQVGPQGPQGPQGPAGPMGPRGPQGPSQIGNWKFKSYSVRGVGAGSFQTPTLFSLDKYYADAVLTVDVFLTMYSSVHQKITRITYLISKESGGSPSVVNTKIVYAWGDTSDWWWKIDGVQISGNNISYKVTANWGGQANYVDMKFTYCVISRW